MDKPRAEIARERRRQMQVRKAFDAGLNLASAPAWEPVAFYTACADYLVFSMDRLHEQDQIIHDLLRERIPARETDAHQRLAVLDERQKRSRALMQTFSRAVEALRASGQKGIAMFQAAAREFTNTFTSLLQPRKNPFSSHTDELFTDADWVRVAGVTTESLATEERLFRAVQTTAPAGVDPAKFTAEHLPT